MTGGQPRSENAHIGRGSRQGISPPKTYTLSSSTCDMASIEPPPLSALAKLAAEQDGVRILLPPVSMDEFAGLFLEPVSPVELFVATIKDGGSVRIRGPWQSRGDVLRVRTIELERSISGSVRKVVHEISEWRLSADTTLIRIKATTPEWAQANKVTSFELILVTPSDRSKRPKCVPATIQTISSPTDSILLLSVYDIEIDRSGIGYMIPAAYARSTAVSSMTADRELWRTLALPLLHRTVATAHSVTASSCSENLRKSRHADKPISSKSDSDSGEDCIANIGNARTGPTRRIKWYKYPAAKSFINHNWQHSTDTINSNSTQNNNSVSSAPDHTHRFRSAVDTTCSTAHDTIRSTECHDPAKGSSLSHANLIPQATFPFQLRVRRAAGKALHRIGRSIHVIFQGRNINAPPRLGHNHASANAPGEILPERNTPPDATVISDNSSELQVSRLRVSSLPTLCEKEEDRDIASHDVPVISTSHSLQNHVLPGVSQLEESSRLPRHSSSQVVDSPLYSPTPRGLTTGTPQDTPSGGTSGSRALGIGPGGITPRRAATPIPPTGGIQAAGTALTESLSVASLVRSYFV